MWDLHPSLFARSNVLVFPSLVPEAFGIAQVEAMASGLVVVTSATGGAREVVRDGVDGLHFESGNHEDLANKLLSLVNDKERWQTLAQQGQERAWQFTVPRIVDRIETSLVDLLERRSSSAEALKR